MALKYYHATNTGKGFITENDSRQSHIAGHPGDIWTTKNTAWATRVGATEKTLEEAQAIVDSALKPYPDNYGIIALRGTIEPYTLPTE